MADGVGMVPLPQHPLGLHRGGFLGLQFLKGHLHVSSRCGWADNKRYTQAEALSLTPPFLVARAWPVGRSVPAGCRSLMARAWGTHGDSWRGYQYTYGEMALLDVLRLATALGSPGISLRISPALMQAAASCASYAPASNEGDKQGRQKLLTDPTRWLNEKQQKNNSRSSDSAREEFAKALWLDNAQKPAWVNAHIATLDARMDQGAAAASPWSLAVDHGGQFTHSVFEKCSIAESVRVLCKQGQVKGAVAGLEVLGEMSNSIDKYLFHSVLKECVLKKDLKLGAQVHALAVEMGFGSDTFLCNQFIRMYAAHGNLQEAMDVFRSVVLPDSFMWYSIISAHVKQGQFQRALKLYQQMRAIMMKPTAHVAVPALQACAATGNLQFGKQVHNDVLTSGMENNKFVCNCLLDMYAKCGSLKDARRVFDGLSRKDVVTWNAMIAGYARVKGMGQEAFSLYSAMQSEGAVPDAVTYVALLQSCTNVGSSALEKGKELHSELKVQKIQCDLILSRSLVNMYVKCGSVKDARIVFDGLREKDVVTWNAMIAGYAHQEGMGQEAFSLHSAMLNEGMVAPNAVTFVCLLQACASVGNSALENGKQYHSEVEYRELQSDGMVGSSLVNMYAKCGSLEDAKRVFNGLREKDVVTWTAMIAGYAQQEGMGQEALTIYGAMCDEGIAIPNAVTYVCLLQACANVGVSALAKGKQLHSQLNERGLESDVFVGGSLVNMYVKCGRLQDARIVFDKLAEKNVVTWTTMIAGYAQQESMSQEALNIYSAMRNEGLVVPNALTYVWLLDACASVGALQQGEQLHSEIRRGGFESDVLIGPCLVKMYAQCGCMEVSREVFDRLPIKNLVTWTALLKGYAEHGQGGMAIQCFEELLEHGIQPDEVAYICLFTACSHAGLVDKGQHYFETMGHRHGVQPSDRLCCCMVDLLGRSGYLARAEQLLQASSFASDAVSWTALLSACKSFGDAEIGRRCFDHLVKLDPTVATPYVLLGSIYANAGRWGEVGRVESMRKAAGARKMPAKACIEVKQEVYEFTVGEERSDVAATLRKMNSRAKEGGHVPQTQLVFKTVSEQEKEDALCGHAEKLALAYGLLNTPAGSTLVVTKNVRMCSDCHSSTKIMSQLERRQIVVRDGHKVHRFQNGACSCQDRP